MGKLIILVGQVASGKSTLAKHLVEKHGFTQIKTITTGRFVQGKAPTPTTSLLRLNSQILQTLERSLSTHHILLLVVIFGTMAL